MGILKRLKVLYKIDSQNGLKALVIINRFCVNEIKRELGRTYHSSHDQLKKDLQTLNKFERDCKRARGSLLIQDLSEKSQEVIYES